VPVTNTGNRPGTAVVQLYVSPPPGPAFRPPKELKAFARVSLGPGHTASAVLQLDERSWARWNPGIPCPDQPDAPAAEREAGWQVDPGRYQIAIGTSSADLVHVVEVEVTGPAAA
jgi:beta-glucosidase